MNLYLFPKAFEIASRVKDPTAVAACGVVAACLLFWITFRKRDKAIVLTVGSILAVGAVFLGALPLLVQTYQSTHGIYQVRVVVLGPDQTPVDKVMVVCSPGGEQKSITGGWECDIPVRNKPADGLFSAYASVQNAYLTGQGQLHLSDDYNPVLTIRLQSDLTATVKGEVQGTAHHALGGVWISVVGSEREGVRTAEGGGFVLAAHASNGQMIKMHAEKKGFKPYDGLQQAGDSSVVVQLTH